MDSAGYNDGLSGAASADEGLRRVLSPQKAQEAQFSDGETAEVDEASFMEGLDRIGVEMLEQGVQVHNQHPPINLPRPLPPCAQVSSFIGCTQL